MIDVRCALPYPVDASRSSFAQIQKRLACLHAGMR
jgi:hypothetical protein